MWAHQPFVNQPKQGFNLMLWPRLELICRWRGDGAVWLALWELEGWRLVVGGGGGSGGRDVGERRGSSSTFQHINSSTPAGRELCSLATWQRILLHTCTHICTPPSKIKPIIWGFFLTLNLKLKIFGSNVRDINCLDTQRTLVHPLITVNHHLINQKLKIKWNIYIYIYIYF